MPEYEFARLRAMHDDPHYQAQAAEWLRSRGVTSLPAGFNTPGEVVLDYLSRTNPGAIHNMLREHERVHGPLPEPAPAPPAQQQQQQQRPQPQQQPPARPAAPKPQPQQQQQSKIDPQMGEKLLKLLAVDKVAAQAAKMKGGSAFRQFLTPQLEQSAAAALKKIGATIPKGHTAGETYLAGLSILKDMSPRELNVIAEKSNNALGDATELRQALSKLTAHGYADRVVAKLGEAAKFDPHRRVEPDEKAKHDTVRDDVAKALREQRARGDRNGDPPKPPRRVYSKEDLDTQKLKDQFFPDRARPIVLTPNLAREIASETRDASEAEAVINGDSGNVASESGGADNA